MTGKEIIESGCKIYKHMKDIKNDFSGDATILNKFYNKKQMFKWLTENNDDYVNDCNKYNCKIKSDLGLVGFNKDTDWGLSAWGLSNIDKSRVDEMLDVHGMHLLFLTIMVSIGFLILRRTDIIEGK